MTDSSVPMGLSEALSTGSLDRLNREQRAQVLGQIRYHLEAPPVEDVPLSDGLWLRLSIAVGVTRPMSSRLLARWLWERPSVLRGASVLDVGTGAGVQGICAALRGARRTVLSDVVPAAVRCARQNVEQVGLRDTCQVVEGDLFAAVRGERFDLIVFAHPYFDGSPIPSLEVTRGMLDAGGLFSRFLTEAPSFLLPGGKIASMGWPFAGPVNDPVRQASAAGFEIQANETIVASGGLQAGSFQAILARPGG